MTSKKDLENLQKQYQQFKVRQSKLAEKRRARNIKILARRIGGATLQRIADDYGMTRERVRQICEQLGCS